ncbi:MAG: PQQ-binding-like beta-propeller repeat protein [Candidatus Sericytochromatia bacterium]|nr:PQQ-binding-like beta-propeller repeat protein [Candidatus Sericytochromatia bacterium]
MKIAMKIAMKQLYPIVPLGLVLAMFLHLPNLAQNNQTSSEAETPGSDNAILWKTRVGLMGYLNQIKVTDQTVYLSSSGRVWNTTESDTREPLVARNGIYALDLESGKIKWSHDTPEDANGIDLNGDLLAYSSETEIGLINRQTGKALWKIPLVHEAYQVKLLGSTLLLGDKAGYLWALDIQTGKVLWQKRFYGEIRSPLTGDANRLFVASTRGEIMALNSAGQILWQNRLTHPYPPDSQRSDPFNLSIYAAPVLVGDRLLIAYARNGTYAHPALLALNAETGVELWRAQDLKRLKTGYGNLRASPAIYQDQLAIWAEPNSNHVVGLDLEKGEVKWVNSAGIPMYPNWAGAVINGRVAVVPRFDGSLYFLNAETGHLLGESYWGSVEEAGKPMSVAKKPTLPIVFDFPPFGDAIYSTPALAGKNTALVACNDWLYRLIIPTQD